MELGMVLEARCEALIADVKATLGLDYSREIDARARLLRTFAGSAPLDKLTEDMQQRIHDERIDTTWPACPGHGNHPLWPHGSDWVCERDDMVIAAIGALGSARRR